MDAKVEEPRVGAPNSTAWLALYTKPHREYFVRDRLQGQGVEVYLPEVRVAVPRRERREYKPFFPHYLFARLDLQDARNANLHWTPGLRSVVTCGGQPVPVPDGVVSALRRRLATMSMVAQQFPYKAGDLVQVAHGPCDGLHAVFDRRLSAEGRVKVFLKLVSHWVAAELDISDLQPVR